MPPDHVREACSLPNLRKAWRWITTNPEPQFKNYVRHVYRAYSLAAEDNLKHLHERLSNGTYKPSYATKLFFPKESGILRPYSLLTIEDQVVYQALINVVAEKFPAHVRKRYGKQVFGHIYAGKRSLCFYRDWKKTYAKFSKAMRKAFDEGYIYAASFDLTACYDSIDHRVIKHFLSEIGLEEEFCVFLCEKLSVWTRTSKTAPIYHGHGIPQGPPPSGFLSECVLRHFEDGVPAHGKLRQFRYVDDIRLFAKSEKDIRRRLVILDTLSKEIGLFPQSSKIHIHKVKSIEDEIKTISNPPETFVADPDPDQNRVRRRLNQLTARYIVKNATRFKYVLGRASPNAGLSLRLLKVLERQPHLYLPILAHLGRSGSLSRRVSIECMRILKTYDLYPSFTAWLLKVMRRRIHHSCKLDMIRRCRYLLAPDPDRPDDAEIQVSAASILLEEGAATPSQTKAYVQYTKDWWVRTNNLLSLQKDLIGERGYEKFVNSLLRDKCADVALIAAELVISEGLRVIAPTRRIHGLAQHSLKKAGIISKIKTGTCPISDAMVEAIDPALAVINWSKLLGGKYWETIPMIVRWNGYLSTDATAWINLTDTLNDIVLFSLYTHDSAIGTYQLGNIGGALTPTPGNRLATKYPLLFKAVKTVHDKRSETYLSHPITKVTGKPTRPIKFSEIHPIKKMLLDGYQEMWTTLGI